MCHHLGYTCVKQQTGSVFESKCMATDALRMAYNSTEERGANIVPKHQNQENNFTRIIHINLGNVNCKPWLLLTVNNGQKG